MKCARPAGEESASFQSYRANLLQAVGRVKTDERQLPIAE